MKATYVLAVDWNGDGDFGDTGEDITADVIAIETYRGRDNASQAAGRSRAGTLLATLENSAGTYNSFNSASPIYGNILPGRKVQWQTNDQFPYTFPLVFANLAIWTGYLERIDPLPSLHGAHRALLRATGPLGRIALKKVTVAMQTNRLTSAAVGDVLDDTQWAAGDRQIQTGQTTMTRWWANDQPALAALREIEETEAGFIWETRDGKIAFDDRRYRLTNSASKTSQVTLSDTAGSNIEYSQVQQQDPLAQIYNIIEARVTRYTVGTLATLWTLSESGANSPRIVAGQTRTWWAQYPNPDSGTDAVAVNAWTTPVENTDYEANTAADGSGTDKSAALTVVVTKFAQAMQIAITNTDAADVFITLLQARGTPVTANDPVKVVAEDATSQTAYDERTYPIAAPWIPDTDEAVDHANYMLAIYKSPIPLLSVTIAANRDESHMVEALTREIDDRVTVVATGGSDLGINEAFHIEAIRHRVDRHRNHWCTYELAPVADFIGFWIVGTTQASQTMKLTY